jgi:peptide/nickel transport system permease protein
VQPNHASELGCGVSYKILIGHFIWRAGLGFSPLLTIKGGSMKGRHRLIGGAIVIEAVFGIPGLGTFGVQGITKRDYQQVQGFILVVALLFVVSNLLVDISYAYFDPRIRYEEKGQ